MLEAIIFLIVGGSSMAGVYKSLFPRPVPNYRTEQSAITYKGMGNVSNLVTEGAFFNLGELLSGPLERASKSYGSVLVIRDAITKLGSSREGDPARGILPKKNSQHNHGKAIDISTIGMSNTQKLKLLKSLQGAGFNGFGFNESDGFLHADVRNSKSGWTYNKQPKWAGESVNDLISQNKNRSNTTESIIPTYRKYE